MSECWQCGGKAQGEDEDGILCLMCGRRAKYAKPDPAPGPLFRIVLTDEEMEEDDFEAVLESSARLILGMDQHRVETKGKKK